MLHPHCSTTFFLYIRPKKKFAPCHSGLPTSTEKSSQPTQPTTPNSIIGIHTELLLLLVMYDKLPQTYRISMWTSMHAQHTTRRLDKITQIAQKKHVTGNAIVVMATLTLCEGYSEPWFLHENTVTFCKFLTNPTLISKLTTSSEIQWSGVSNNVLSVTKILSTFTWVEYKNTVKNALQTSGAKNPKPTLPLRACGLSSKSPIPQMIPLTTPNGIQIQSAVLPQYTLRTDWLTDWPTDKQTNTWHWQQICTKSCLHLIVSDAANNYS